MQYNSKGESDDIEYFEDDSIVNLDEELTVSLDEEIEEEFEEDLEIDGIVSLENDELVDNRVLENIEETVLPSVEDADGNLDLFKLANLSEEDKNKLIILDSYNETNALMIADVDNEGIDTVEELTSVDLTQNAEVVSKVGARSLCVTKENRSMKGVTIENSLKKVESTIADTFEKVKNKTATILTKDSQDDTQKKLIELIYSNNKGLISPNRMNSLLVHLDNSTADELSNISSFIQKCGFEDEINDDIAINRFKVLCKSVIEEIDKIRAVTRRKSQTIMNIENKLHREYFLKDLVTINEMRAEILGGGINTDIGYLASGNISKELTVVNESETRVNEHKTVYVEKVILSDSGERFICGDCKEENKSKVDFLSTVVCSGEGRDFNTSTLALFNVCTHCGSVNVVSNEEASKYDKYVKKVCDLSRDFKISVSNKIPPISRYIPSYKNMTSLFPDLYEVDTNNLVATLNQFNKDEDVTLKDLDWEDAVKLYRDKVRAFSKRKSLNLFNETNLSDSIRKVRNIIPTNGEKIAREDSYTYRCNLLMNTFDTDKKGKAEKLTLALVNILGYDYSELKQYAIDSLVSFLLSNPVGSSIDGGLVLPAQSVLNTKKYFNGDRKLDPIEANNVISTLLRGCSSPITTILNDRSLIDVDLYAKAKEYLAEYYDYSQEILDTSKNRIKRLEESSYMYSYVPINKVTCEDRWRILYDEELCAWVDNVSNLMMLNHLSEDMLDFFKPVKSTIKGDINVSYKSRLNKIKDPSTDREKAEEIEKILELLSERSGVKDLSELTPYFILSHNIDIESLFKVVKLSTAIKSENIFSISNCLLNMEDFLRNTRILDVPHLDGIRALLVSQLRNAENFLKNYSNNLNGKMSYYFPEFSDETEVTKLSLIELVESNKFKLKVNTDETAEDYIERFKNIGDEIPRELLEILPNNYLDELSDFIPIIFGVANFYIYCSDNVKELRSYLYMKDLIMNLLNCRISDIFRVFDINENFITFFEDNCEQYIIDAKNSCKANILEISLNNFAYTKASLNDIFVFTDDSLDNKISSIYNTEDATEGQDDFLELRNSVSDYERGVLDELYSYRG